MTTASEIDNTAAGAILAHRSIDSIAEEIQRLHDEAEDAQSVARESIENLIAIRRKAGALAETARNADRKNFHKWWRDAGLPEEWDSRYCRIANASHRNAMGDKIQLQLVGALPPAEARAATQSSVSENPFAWTKFAGKLRTSLSEEKLAAFDEGDKEIACKQLAPIAQLFVKLGGML
jgi:hypothetical protein